MISEDIEYLRTKPNFKKYLDGGSQVRTIRTIYPSVTYPAHVSMMTGCYPEKTGVCSNFAFTTNSKEDTWLWFHENVKCGDIFTAAKRGGYSTGAVFWPVLGNHPDIDYNINEYWMPKKGDTLRSSFERVGANEECLEIMKRAGCKTTLEEIGKSEELFNKCVRYSPFMRRRLTLLRLQDMIEV